MKKIIDELLPLTKKLTHDWSPFYTRHNLEKDVKILFDNYDQETSNIIFSYVVLAYFQHSPWVRNHKDRLENKVEILSSLLKTEAPFPEPFQSLLENTNTIANEIIDWALRFQQDWRIPMIETYQNFQSHMRLMGSRLDPIDITKNINVGKALDEGRKRREEAEELQKSFDAEYKDINAALQSENRSKLSEIPSNVRTWEQHILLLKHSKEETTEDTDSQFS